MTDPDPDDTPSPEAELVTPEMASTKHLMELISGLRPPEPQFEKILEIEVPAKYVMKAYKLDDASGMALRQGAGHAPMYRMFKFVHKLAVEQDFTDAVLDEIFLASKQSLYCLNGDARYPVIVMYKQVDDPDDPDDGEEAEEGRDDGQLPEAA